jgi:hypothetical protein
MEPLVEIPVLGCILPVILCRRQQQVLVAGADRRGHPFGTGPSRSPGAGLYACMSFFSILTFMNAVGNSRRRFGLWVGQWEDRASLPLPVECYPVSLSSCYLKQRTSLGKPAVQPASQSQPFGQPGDGSKYGLWELAACEAEYECYFMLLIQQNK